MGIQNKLNTSFPDVSSFAAAAGAGVQEDLAPLRTEIAALRNEITGLRNEVSDIRSGLGNLQSQLFDFAANAQAQSQSV